MGEGAEEAESGVVDGGEGSSAEDGSSEVSAVGDPGAVAGEHGTGGDGVAGGADEAEVESDAEAGAGATEAGAGAGATASATSDKVRGARSGAARARGGRGTARPIPHTAIPVLGADDGAAAGGGSASSHDVSLNSVGVAANFTHHRGGGGPKEKIGQGHFDADGILKQLYIPRTETWKGAKVNRLIVSKAAPENKYHPAGKMHAEALPASDLTVTFDTCAVIGNGGVLVHNEYGDAIDRHDAVFRFNDGPTQGFEKLVGSKTTFRIINNNWSRAWLRKRARGATEVGSRGGGGGGGN